jgi:hypothetical protein
VQKLIVFVSRAMASGSYFELQIRRYVTCGAKNVNTRFDAKVNVGD